MKFQKYQALGNDYLVFDVADKLLDTAAIRKICDRRLGVGADGILLAHPATTGSFPLRIFNPDGSEAEKSGNGIRIYARYLWDGGLVRTDPFFVDTKGGTVRCQMRDEGRLVFVEMGQASFSSDRIPVRGAKREVVDEWLDLPGERIRFTGVTIGNPHCVVHVPEVSAALARRLGPVLERYELFPNRTNVQFVKVIDRHQLQIEIWERGAGYTLASGSSSCAAAAASVRLRICSGDIAVHMPGGIIQVEVKDDFSVNMIGPVVKVFEGTIG